MELLVPVPFSLPLPCPLLSLPLDPLLLLAVFKTATTNIRRCSFNDAEYCVARVLFGLSVFLF